MEILRGDGVDSVRRLRGRIEGDLMIRGSLTLTDALFRARQVDVLRLRTVRSCWAKAVHSRLTTSATCRCSMSKAIRADTS